MTKVFDDENLNLEFLDKAQDISEQQIQQQRQLITIISVNDKNARDIIYYMQEKQLEDLSQIRIWKRIKLFIYTLPKVSNPNSTFRIFWEMASMIFIFIQMIEIPLVLAYSIDINEGFSDFDQIMNSFFYIDLLLNFKLAYYDRGDLIFDFKKIAINYMKLWFWVDFFALLPYDQIFDFPSNSTQVFKVVRFLKFIKIIRLIRVMKLNRILQKIEESFSLAKTFQTILQFLKITAMILSICHWIACIWNIIEYTDEQIDLTWMAKYGIEDADWEIKYITAFYFSVTTMITVGYGDINANTQREMIFAVFAMVLASAIFGYSMSSFIYIIEGEDEQIMEQKIQNSKIVKYIKQKSIPQELYSRVKNYLEWLAGSAQIARNHEQYVLKSLSANLKTEIVCLLNGRILHKVKLFGKEFSSQLINKLVYVLNEQMLGPEEFVFKENSFENERIYFIQNGLINICLTKKETILTTLSKGDYFGEIAFFGNTKRNASAKTVDFVNVMSLKRKDLWDAAKPLEDDLFKLYFIRECLAIENNLKPLKLRCYLCDRPSHIARNCTVFHYRVSRKNVILNDLEKINSRNVLFERKKNYKKRIEYIKLKQDTTTYQVSFNRNEKQYKLNNLEIAQQDIKVAFDIDNLKEYPSFFEEFNITNVAQELNYRAEQIQQKMRAEKQLLQTQRRLTHKRLKEKTVAPRQSKVTFMNMEMSLNNSISLQSSQPLITSIGEHRTKSKRLLELQSSKNFTKRSLTFSSQKKFYQNKKETSLVLFSAKKQITRVQSLDKYNSKNQAELYVFKKELRMTQFMSQFLTCQKEKKKHI